MASDFGYAIPTIRPPSLGAMEFREARMERETGYISPFQQLMAARIEQLEERPDVMVNRYLVFVPKRPQLSDQFYGPPLQREFMNRRDYVGRHQQEYSVAGATPPRPIATQLYNADFNKEQYLQRTRKVM